MATNRPLDVLGLDYALIFTKAYQEGSRHSPYVREQRCEDVQFPAVLVSPRATDWLCGKRLYPEVGYSPQYGGMGYYFNLPEGCGTQQEWKELQAFWEQEATTAQCWREFPAEVRERLPRQYGGGNGDLSQPGYALFRIAGLQLDYGKLVKLGVPGLEKLVTTALEKAKDDEGRQFLEGALASAKRLGRCLVHWKVEATKLPETPQSLQMQKVLQGLTEHAPQSFHEGLQLVLAVQTITGTINFGRLDTALGPLLCHDLDSGSLRWSHALELMKNFYTVLEEEIGHWDARIIVGGKGRANEDAADRFALLAMETTDSLSLPMPQLTLRFYEGQNPELLTKAYDVIGHGKTFPMLYNDDVNVPAAAKAFAVDEKTAEQYIPFGCGESIIDHQSCGTPNFIINLQLALELALNHGKNLEGRTMAPDFGGLEEYSSFDSLWQAYTKTTEWLVNAGALGQASIYQTTGRECPFSLISLLYDDCLARQRPLLKGGVKYLGGTNETYGNNNTADSLTALNELVYKAKKYTLGEVLVALRADWVGFEAMREDFKNAPKYGNDEEIADSMVQKVDHHICVETSVAARQTHLHHFLVVIINNNHNTLWGKTTGASTDGRRYGEPLAPGNSASAGSDKKGLTALLNSQSKVDPSVHAGAVQNVKLSSSFPQKNRDLYHALFAGYWKQGGAQTMVTVTNRQDLLAALEHPENYANLLVRVGGFSARFIDLDKATQQEVLSRTTHG